MEDEQIWNQENLDLFWRFVYERQSVWHRRVIQQWPQPWTADPILQKNKFTNIYRELDPGTIFVKNNILETKELIHNKIFNVMIYRLMCSIPTYKHVGFQRISEFNTNKFAGKLAEIYASGQPVFGNAYMISPYSHMGSDFKYVNVARLFGQIHQNFSMFYRDLTSAPTLEKAFKEINKLYGFGPFLAYQVCVDLLYPLNDLDGRSILPFKHDDWARLGPGALRGYSRLVNHGWALPPLRGLRVLHQSQRSEFARLGMDFPFLQRYDDSEIEISLSNMQNCLCEFHKYASIREGSGKAQRLFVPSDLRKE